MFNTSNGGYSLSDVAAVTRNNNSEDGFGGNGAWWLIVLFLFVFCGWGDGNGFGRNGGTSGTAQGALTRADLCSEFSFNNLDRAVTGIQQGLCDGFYAMNTGILNGFNGVDNAVCNLGYQTQQGFNNTNVALMQGQSALASQLADCCCTTSNNLKDVQFANQVGQNALQNQLSTCCCDIERQVERSFADTNYRMATDTCTINTNNANNTRDIIDSQNANTRAILEAIQQGKIDAMQDKIASLTAQNNQLSFAASQAAQNAYLVNELRPSPIPAYVTSNPWGCNNGNGYNSCAAPFFYGSGCCNN